MAAPDNNKKVRVAMEEYTDEATKKVVKIEVLLDKEHLSKEIEKLHKHDRSDNPKKGILGHTANIPTEALVTLMREP